MMIFQHTWQQVLDGSKTQTRRLMKPGDFEAVYDSGRDAALQGDGRYKWVVGRTYAVQPGRGKKAIGRIRLTGIRREQVQDISEADAVAEGCEAEPCPDCGGACWHTGTGMMEDPNNPYGEPLPYPIQVPCEYCNGVGWMATPSQVYAELWDSIHAKSGNSWACNPDVWVLEFELA